MSEAMNPTHGEPPKEGAPEYESATTGDAPESSDERLDRQDDELDGRQGDDGDRNGGRSTDEPS